MYRIWNMIKKIYDNMIEARRLEEEYYESTNIDAFHKVNTNKFM